MTALRTGDIVAIIGKITGVSQEGDEAEVNFHLDPKYGPEDVVLLQTAGLKLMEHGDPDYGVKIIDGVPGEWTIQSRLSSSVAVMQRVNSDPDNHDNFQVVAVDRLKTQDKDLYRLVTGAELSASAGNGTAQAPEEQPARSPVLKAPSLTAAAPKQPEPASETNNMATEHVTHAAAPSVSDPQPIPAAAPPTMMRPDKLAAPGHDAADAPQAVDASIARTANEDARIREVADLSRDPGVGSMVQKAGHLAEARATTQAGTAAATAPALRTPSLAQPSTTERRVDLSSIADHSAEYQPPAE